MNANQHREIAKEADSLCEPVHFYSTKFPGPLRPRSAIITGGSADANVFAVAVFANADDNTQPVTVYPGVPFFATALERVKQNPHCDTWCLPIEASREFLNKRAKDAREQEQLAAEQIRRINQAAAGRTAEEGAGKGGKGAESKDDKAEGDEKKPPKQ